MEELEEINRAEDTDQSPRDTSHPVRMPAPGDLELIRWAGSLSYEDRLTTLQDFVDTFWTPQHG